MVLLSLFGTLSAVARLFPSQMILRQPRTQHAAIGGPSPAYGWKDGQSLFWQLVALFAVCLYVYQLHLHNDGLWFQGDSPRHAANGLFWWDFLSAFPVHPVRFAMSYYARYPVIQPAAYPPLFYLLEGFAFSVFGPSPYVAKTLVSIVALVSGIYVVAWLRRWVAPEAGWGGLLFTLQPGVIQYSSAVMLNMPSVMLGMGALYHTRRGTEPGQNRKHLYLACCYVLAGVLTYFPGGIVAPIVFVWIVTAFGWKILVQRRVLIMCGVATLLLVPLAILAQRWSPGHVDGVLATFRSGLNPRVLYFYLDHLTDIMAPIALFLAIAGLFVTICSRNFRGELKYLLTWICICFATFCLITFRDIRYLMLLIPPVIILAVIGLLYLSRWWGAMFGRSPAAVLFILVSLLTAHHLIAAPVVRIPDIHGFRELAHFLEEMAPKGRILYDGHYDGIFSFYMRAGDPDFRRGVVLGDKLVYSMRFYDGKAIDNVHSSSDVVKLLHTNCGCEWLAIEKAGAADWIPSARYLREAVTGPEFQHIKTFVISAPQSTTIDVYRFLQPLEVPEQFELHFPNPDGGDEFRARPVTR